MGVRVLAVGHILVDIKVRVKEFSDKDELSPIKEVCYGVGGSAANVAIGVKRLGGEEGLLGKVGMDSFGRIAIDELMKERVSLEWIKIEPRCETGFTIVIINKDGDLEMYGTKGASEALTPEEVSAVKMDGYDFVHIASLRADSSLAAAKLAKEAGATVTFDPGRELINKGMRHLSPMLKHADILLLNMREAGVLTGCQAPENAADSLLKAGAKGVIIKLGGEGVYYKIEGKEGRVPAFKVKAIDTTGAGDAFASGFLIRMGEGEGPDESIRFGNAVAAMKVTKLGSHEIPVRNEVEEFISSYK
ncbi:MAG: carbohydrate kinase family protein [Candidatus Methanomethyliaceae archaeon]|nr:carbohydrate kinase family protein [Candidatus Methanomethyliaceae archaeon]